MNILVSSLDPVTVSLSTVTGSTWFKNTAPYLYFFPLTISIIGMKLCPWDLQTEFAVIRYWRRLKERDLAGRRKHCSSCSDEQAWVLWGAERLLLPRYTWRNKCDAQRQSTCIWQGRMPSPTWVLSGTARTGPALESHMAAASQPLLLLPLVFGRGRQDSVSPFLMAFRDSTARYPHITIKMGEDL